MHNPSGARLSPTTALVKNSVPVSMQVYIVGMCMHVAVCKHVYCSVHASVVEQEGEICQGRDGHKENYLRPKRYTK